MKLTRINNTYGTYEFECPYCNQTIRLTRNMNNFNLGVFQCGNCESVLSAKVVENDIEVTNVSKNSKVEIIKQILKLNSSVNESVLWRKTLTQLNQIKKNLETNKNTMKGIN